MTSSSERHFIDLMRSIARNPGARDLQDDCAVLPFGTETLIITHDMMVEGTHFLTSQDMADVAWKLVTVNLSDLAAKGAEPIGVLLGYALGHDDAGFAAGLAEACAAYGAPLLGGDTVRGSGPRSFGLTALGRATCTPVPDRRGARAGDQVYLTGPVGAAMIGLENLRAGNGDTEAYRRPRALLTEGRALAPHVSAMMDVSDGVLLDAARLARASGVTLALNGAAIPLACAPTRRAEALRWGDDYQLLFTLAPRTDPAVPAFHIGEVHAAGATPLLLDRLALSETDGLGYEH